ncbi:MAG: hypothetical protein A4E73_00660 [Syntrophaceae bacterium PtaU1.Bin231]|nr:MAG: hypothetical protein A4E73_00660 [Syntrophaceae bacterium PtaU1.Bin231]
MERQRKTLAAAVFFIAVGLIAGLVIPSDLNIFTKSFSQEVKISKESIDTLSKINEATAEVAAAVKPAVVNISMSQTVHMRDIPFFDDPFFRQFFGNRGRPRDYKQRGLGSGVIVADVAQDSAEADILTRGDIIMEVNRKKIANTADYSAAIAEIKSGQDALVLVYRNGTTVYITI